MRMIDAEKLKDVLENVKNHLEAYPNVLASYKECVMSLIDVVNAQPTITPPPNEALTLEQLREMDGEPVWCVDGRGNQCWCLVNCDDDLLCCYDNETGLWEDCFYGMTGDWKFGLHQYGWLAYRGRPEIDS